MTAFLKIDRCEACRQEIPWEWVPPILLGGAPLAGTGVWRRSLVDGLCARCFDAIEADHRLKERSRTTREILIKLLGGIKPYREFTFERYEVTAGNQAAFEKAKRFDPASDNLYLWGPSGIGKTHLALAALRRWFERGRSAVWATPSQLIRKLRMKAPDEEQQAIDGFIRADIFLLDDFGVGSDTPYARQVLQEILDGRGFRDCGGLVVTSKYSRIGLVRRLNDDAIPSRLAGMCQVVEVKGIDHRLANQAAEHGANPGTKGC